MNMTCHAFLQDKQIRKYLLFLLSCALLLIHMALLFSMWLTRAAGDLLLTHDKAGISSLLAQGIPEHTIAEALTSADTDHVQAAADLLARLGISRTKDASFWPPLHHYGNAALFSALSAVLLLSLLILAGTLVFLHKRASLYEQALKIVDDYQNGDYSRRLPQTEEGSLYHLFASVDRLATMQQAQRENERRSAIFLRNTISDISHQLKTPLAALSMYQEIMENEPDKPDVIRKFTAKTGTALRRMEELIQSMLKITRLDTGSIVFEKKLCPLTELVSHALSELTTRAEQEQKEILLNGSPDDTLLCDPAWTMEAIGNLVKNALDHTSAGGIIRIEWDKAPAAVRIRVSDDGNGILPEDIHHIFKRFYRSRKSLDTQGIGLGLPLAKSIVEGQGGTISVHSTPHVGTTFLLLFNR